MVIGARFVWLFTTPYLIRLLDRRLRQRAPRRHPRPSRQRSRRVQEAVSLAPALSVPQMVASGQPFPDHDMIVFLTGVIVVTLAQWLLLPRVVRWARLPRDTSVGQERHLAETLAAEEAEEVRLSRREAVD